MKLWLENKKKETKKKYDLENKSTEARTRTKSEIVATHAKANG